MAQSDIKKIKESISLLRYAADSGVRFERRADEYWACCPFHDEKTPSFAVKLKDGEEVFFCQGCRKGGDLISFVELREHISKKDAISKLSNLCYAPEAGATFAENNAWAEQVSKVAQTFTNLADAKPKETLTMEQWRPFETALAQNKEAISWLNRERGITIETAKQLHFGFQQKNKGCNLPPELEHTRDGGWILFPRIVGDEKTGKVVAIKKRSITAKAFTQVPHMDARALFNSESANALEDLYVTEGEFDAAIMEQAGFRAVSIPNASAKCTPENKIIMKRAYRVFLAGDNDGTVGTAAMQNLRRELGSNTYMLAWPGAKDANEFFIKQCGRNVEEFRRRVTALTSEALSTPIEGFTSLVSRMRARKSQGATGAKNNPRRLHFPFERLDNMSYSLPGSVVTFYSTYSGTGKTVFTTQVMLKEAERGETVVVYSPEVRDDMYLALVCAQLVGSKRLASGGLNRAEEISDETYDECIAELEKPSENGEPPAFYVGHSLPVSDGKEVLDFIEAVIMATGATRFVIDTFHRIVAPVGRESVVDAEGRTMRKLEELAIAHQCVFVIIGQSNKEAEDLKEVRKDAHGTLRGNREITDISDAVYLVHRKRNPDVQEGKEADGVDLLVPETTVVLVKGRVQGTTGKFTNLFYEKRCSKFFPLQNTSTSSTVDNATDAGFGG